jgi:hypothetical protein
MILVTPQEDVQDRVASDLVGRLAWKTIDAHGIANVLQSLRPQDRSAVVSKMIWKGADAPIVNAALAMSFSPMRGFGAESPEATEVWKAYWTNPTWNVIRTVSMVASVYHGYRRNDSVGWALWWGLMGSIFPIITPTIALAQGFGEPER